MPSGASCSHVAGSLLPPTPCLVLPCVGTGRTRGLRSITPSAALHPPPPHWTPGCPAAGRPLPLQPVHWPRRYAHCLCCPRPAVQRLWPASQRPASGRRCGRGPPSQTCLESGSEVRDREGSEGRCTLAAEELPLCPISHRRQPSTRTIQQASSQAAQPGTQAGVQALPWGEQRNVRVEPSIWAPHPGQLPAPQTLLHHRPISLLLVS